MDKQSMIDRLMWSGATLYDLASNRLRAVKSTTSSGQEAGTDRQDSGDSSAEGPADTGAASGLASGGGETAGGTLTDLFATDVSREMLVDALDQMHQPRDAFKFLYQVIQEHCNTVPDDAAAFHALYHAPELYCALLDQKREPLMPTRDELRGR